MTDAEGEFNFSLTNEEIDFLLEILNNKETKEKEEVEYLEEELRNFLKEQLQKIKNNRISKDKKDDPVREKNQLMLQTSKDKTTATTLIKKSLEKKIGKRIILNLNTAEDCCTITGIICKIEQDFVIVLEQDYKTYVKLDTIVAVQNKIGNYNKAKCNNYEDKNNKLNNAHQEHDFTQNNNPIDFNNEVECKKFEKNYVNLIE